MIPATRPFLRNLLPAACLLVLLPVSSARAHRLHAEARVLDDRIRAEFFFSDGLPARGLQVVIETDAGPAEILGQTDDQGAIAFRPTGPGPFRLIARGAGHSNAGRPLIISPEMVAEALRAAETATSRPAAAEASSGPEPQAPVPGPPPGRRPAVPFPWREVLASLAFVFLLTAFTLVLMRACAASPLPRKDDPAALRAEVENLRRELEVLRRQVGRRDPS